MALEVRKVRKRLRSKRDMLHRPTVVGAGKWHSRVTLWRYKRKARRKRQIASASRAMNRARR